MHVRIAWEIYTHQSKQNSDRSNQMKTVEMLRNPTHLHHSAASSSLLSRSELPLPGPYHSSGSLLAGRSMFEAGIPSPYLTPSSHLGKLLIFFFATTKSVELISLEKILNLNKNLPFTGVSPFSRFSTPFPSHGLYAAYGREHPLGPAYPAYDPWRT